MTQKLEAQGIKGDREWDDGSDHDDVTMIYVRGGLQGIQQIRFGYVKNGQPKYGSTHGIWDRGFTQTFEINHLKNEHLESVEGYYKGETGELQALQFKTNLKISEIMGYEKCCNKFTLAVDGKKIIGFHGSHTLNMYSLGAYFTWITPTRMEAKGGKESQEWDEGVDHEGITKIHVRGGPDGIQFIKFDYLKSGEKVHGSIHGGYGKGFRQMFKINNLEKEYLISVEGYYDDASKIVQGLLFKTNMKTHELMGYDKGTKFSLAAQGKKIIGFHGSADGKNLNSLGAYFTTLPLIKLQCQGGSGGDLWDDGVSDGIRKVYVTYGDSGINRISFVYNNGGKMENHDHSFKNQKEGEFALDYPHEFIRSIEGTIISTSTDSWITSMTFRTSEGRTSPTFGNAHGSNHTEFLLKSKGCVLVGFHGQSSSFLNAIGAYCYPLTRCSNKAKKLKEHGGGDGGVSWDDGGFDGVRKIYIGLSKNAVAFVKFLYNKDSEMVVGDDHGNQTILGIEEFTLDYPNEYIISVEGSYDVVPESNNSEVILMLRFTTNIRTSPYFGYGEESSFTLQIDRLKIVGFYGKSSNLLHQIGVYVFTIDDHLFRI